MAGRGRWLTGAAVALVAAAGSSFLLHPLRSVVDVSWAEAYPSLAEMTQHSDAVVEGRVTKVVGSGTRADEGNTVYTDFTVHVDRWIAGTPTGESITVHQMGGASGLYETTVRDDPLLQVDNRAFLFVRRYAPGRYFVMGGPTGRLPVVAGRVTTMPDSIVSLTSTDPAAVETQLVALAAGQGKSS